MNIDRFRNTTLIRPTEEVPVPELCPLMFDTKEEAVFRCVALETNDVFKIKEQLRASNPLLSLAKALESSNNKDMADAFRTFLGGSKDTAAETMTRIEFLIRSVVDKEGKQVFNHTDAAKIAQHFPDMFVRVTDRIMKISGEPSHVSLDK